VWLWEEHGMATGSASQTQSAKRTPTNQKGKAPANPVLSPLCSRLAIPFMLFLEPDKAPALIGIPVPL
jgi:hypothetical protein